uniref:Secreted protein n=1 Tax=Ascaris lumbricoides TaxID=6252 RepID=A0A0M3HET9_ASCLU
MSLNKRFSKNSYAYLRILLALGTIVSAFVEVRLSRVKQRSVRLRSPSLTGYFGVVSHSLTLRTVLLVSLVHLHVSSLVERHHRRTLQAASTWIPLIGVHWWRHSLMSTSVSCKLELKLSSSLQHKRPDLASRLLHVRVAMVSTPR